MNKSNVLRQTFFFLILSGFVVLFLGGCGGESGSDTDHPVEKWMSVYDGSIYDLEYEVKKMLHDPSSFEHVETSYNDQGVEVKVRMKFRAKNKFGALVLSQADAILDTDDGTVSEIKIQQ